MNPSRSEACLTGARHGFGATGESKRGEDVGYVVAHRLIADDEAMSYLGVGEPPRNEVEHFLLPYGQYGKRCSTEPPAGREMRQHSPGDRGREDDLTARGGVGPRSARMPFRA